MRVLLVTNDFPPDPGGIQQYLAGWVGSFPGKVRVIAPRGGAWDGDIVRDRARFMWPTRRVRSVVLEQIEDFAPDILLFGAPHPLAHLGPGLRRASGIPYAVLCHGAEVTVPAAFPVGRQLVAWPLRRADLLLAVSRYTGSRVERISGKPVTLVGAGVDEAFAPGEPPAATVIGCVSRFVPRKGQARVLHAAAALCAEDHPVEVLLVGKGRDERRLRRLAERLRVPTTFEVGVPFSALPDLYRSMTLFAMPCRSRWLGLEVEGFGLVYLEAAASGLPVVAGTSGGAPEAVRPGVTGFVAGDDEALLEAMRFLIDRPDEARAMGAAGAAWVRETFSWEVVGERFLEAFREIRGST